MANYTGHRKHAESSYGLAPDLHLPVLTLDLGMDDNMGGVLRCGLPARNRHQRRGDSKAHGKKPGKLQDGDASWEHCCAERQGQLKVSVAASGGRLTHCRP